MLYFTHWLVVVLRRGGGGGGVTEISKQLFLQKCMLEQHFNLTFAFVKHVVQPWTHQLTSNVKENVHCVQEFYLIAVLWCQFRFPAKRKHRHQNGNFVLEAWGQLLETRASCLRPVLLVGLPVVLQVSCSTVTMPLLQ